MKKHYFLKSIFILLFLFSSTCFAQYDNNNHLINDKVILNIQQNIKNDPSLAKYEVYVQKKNDDTVEITGVIQRDEEAERLVLIAAQAQGVNDVDVSDLKVTKGRSSTYAADTAVTTRIKSAFVKEKLLSENAMSASIKVNTIRCIVILSGQVNNKNVIENSIKVAKKQQGVCYVVPKLRVRN